MNELANNKYLHLCKTDLVYTPNFDSMPQCVKIKRVLIQFVLPLNLDRNKNTRRNQPKLPETAEACVF